MSGHDQYPLRKMGGFYTAETAGLGQLSSLTAFGVGSILETVFLAIGIGFSAE
jgi:hypothetical protein